MRPSLSLLAIVLLALGAVAPLAEAFEDCRPACEAERSEDCDTSSGCSCCPVVRATVDDTPGSAIALTPCRGRVVPPDAAARECDPHGILHVPKPVLA